MRKITFRSNLLKFTFLLGTMLLSVGAWAQVKSNFEPRFSETVNGDITIIANNVLSEHPTNDYNGTSDNNSIFSSYVDIDTDGSTFNSSSANLTNPSPASSCLTYTKVYLYWAAANKENGPDNNGNITGNGNPEVNWPFDQVKLMLPGSSTYNTITADEVIYDGRAEHFVNDPYVCVKDITTEVQGLADPYGKFQVANVKATVGNLFEHIDIGDRNTGTSGGWQIVFVYESPELHNRNITLFDGYANVTQTDNSFDILFDGFQTVPSGPVNANVVIGSTEGDRGIHGDQLQIFDTSGSWTPLSTGERDVNNFFNSKITIDESPFLDRNPASTNTLGFDASLFELRNNARRLIDNDQTSATFRLTSNQETYGLYLMGLSVEVFEPSLGALSFTTNVVGSTFDPGDNAPVEVRVKNVGNDDIENLEISLILPPQVEFTSTEPLPPGVTFNFDNATRELRFFVEDGYTDINDPEYELDFNLFINHECVTCSADIGLQAMATFTGATNTNVVSTLSSGTTDACGVGNHDPTYLRVIPVISFDDASATEGNAIPFGIRSSHLLARDAIVNVSYANITASDNDYSPFASYTIPTGTGNTIMNLPTIDDTFIEIDETLDITLTSSSEITILDNTARGTIIDNDNITGTGIAFTDNNVIVTEGTDTFAIYTVTLTGNISENVTVDYTTIEGTALNPGDFISTTGTLTFTPLINSLDIQVPITDDNVIEATESFTLELSNVQSNIGIGFVDGNTTNTANGTINDDDSNVGDGIAFTDNNVVVTEGTDAFAVYTVTLTGNISENVTVDYTTIEGTALNPGDFISTTGTLTFTPLINSLDIQVPITDDNVIEATEGFTLELSNVQSNIGIGFVDGNTTNTANGTINDDDSNVGDGIAFTDNNVIVTEGTDAFAIYTVTLTGNISENVTVDYTTIEGTALNPGDFISTTGTLTFTPLINSLDIQVPITDDNVIEATEGFTLELSNVQSNIGIGFVDGNTTNTANGTINDDDSNVGDGIAFTDNNVIVTEGTDAFAIYTVTLTGNISENVTVDYTTIEGTALNPGDFISTTGTLTFTPLINSLDIQVPITDDNVIEATEGFTLELSNVQSNIGIGFVDGNTTNTANGTINDDDSNVGDGIAFTDNNVIVTEGTDAFAIYTVTLTGNISENVTVDYTTIEGTALNPGDFISTTGTLTFTPLINSLDIQVPITDDNVIEATEGFTLELSNVQSNIGIGFVDGNTTNTANGTINDDDSNVGDGIAFTDNNVIVTEGTDAFAIYTVTLTGNISENVTVDYTTIEGTALNPGDFISTTGTLTFTPLINSLDIQVPITDDNVIEATESFTLELSNVQSNIGIGFVDGNTTNTANGTINDDDSNVGDGIAFTDNNVVVTEGTDAFAVYTVTLTGNISENVTVDYTTIEGTALNPGDFISTTGTLTFTPLINSLDIQVPITDDNVIEATEGFTLELSNVQSNIGIGFVDGNTTNTANGTINDDDMGEIMVNDYTTEYTIMCGEAIPAIPTLTFTGACGGYTVDFTETEEFTAGTEDYMIIRTWNVADICGNTATFEQIIFVMQQERAIITLDICVDDAPIDLLDSLPADFDMNGTFTVTNGNAAMNGSFFDPQGLELGEYIIEYASVEGDCKYYADFTITVNNDCVDCNLEDLIVSKTVTVNGDGINDYFELNGLESCGFTYEVQIFNRWGTMVYTSKDYQNDWGGYSPDSSIGNAGILPTGTYFYIVSVPNTNTKPINGYIYIGSSNQ